MVATEPEVAVVVTCMGRLEYLKRTLPVLLRQPKVRLCLVDFCCPEGAGDWLEATFGEDVRSGRAMVERVRDREFFNKSAAQNHGAKRALREGAEYLCFLDADTLVDPAFVPWLHAELDSRRFLIAGLGPRGADELSLTGVLVLHRDAYQASGGFDEQFLGWGAEDIEFRIRLFLLHGLAYGEIPLHLLSPLQHGDELRSRFYAERDIRVSNQRNLRRLHHKIWREWRGRWKNDLSSAERLWFQSPASRLRRGAWGPVAPRPTQERNGA